jgi:hypothetical protein
MVDEIDGLEVVNDPGNGRRLFVVYHRQAMAGTRR